MLSLSGDETSLSEDGGAWNRVVVDLVQAFVFIASSFLRSALGHTTHITTSFLCGIVQKTYLNALSVAENTRSLNLPVYAASCVAGHQPSLNTHPASCPKCVCVCREPVLQGSCDGPTYRLLRAANRGLLRRCYGAHALGLRERALGKQHAQWTTPTLLIPNSMQSFGIVQAVDDACVCRQTTGNRRIGQQRQKEHRIQLGRPFHLTHAMPPHWTRRSNGTRAYRTPSRCKGQGSEHHAHKA